MSKLLVFMIMPFQDVFLALYERLKVKYNDEFIFEHAADFNDTKGQQSILNDIVNGIAKADVVIAEISGLNPNVMYELGLSHAFKKKVILLTQNIGEMSFDIRSYRAIEYSTRFDLIDKMDNKIDQLMSAVKNNSKDFGNPATDYIKYNIIFDETILKKEITDNENTSESQMVEFVSTSEPQIVVIDEEDDDEKGYLDYYTDINDNTIVLTQMLNDINTDMITMTSGISEKTKDIQRVQNTPGSNNAIFIRNAAQKVAEIMNKYSDKMEPFNRKYTYLWYKIETSYLDILNNKYMIQAKNIDSLQSNKEQLKIFINTIYGLKNSSGDMIESMNSIIRIERRLNKATTRLTVLFQEFINNLETTIASADRICERIIFLSSSLMNDIQ